MRGEGLRVRRVHVWRAGMCEQRSVKYEITLTTPHPVLYLPL
jgi:hypothetical protein